MPPRTKSVELPKTLKCYSWHGVDFDKVDGDQAIAECPFCGKSGKFSVEVETTKYRCWSCEERGNNYEFLARVHQLSLQKATDYSWLSDHRGLSESALREWGVCRSYLTRDWIVPGYGPTGKMNNLYRYVQDRSFHSGRSTDRITGKWRLYGTPEMPIGLFMPAEGLLEGKAGLDICEGLWDAIAWRDRLITTDNERYKTTNVVGVPGCNNFVESWARLGHNRTVTLLFDNDHPRVNDETNKTIQPALDGAKRTAGILAGVTTDDKPIALQWLDWGANGTGYEADLDDGFDLRDALLGDDTDNIIQFILDRVKPVPEEWVQGKGIERGANKTEGIQALPCSSWKELVNAHKLAAKWTPELNGALAVLLASVVSVRSGKERIWVRLISPPSTYKSQLCGAIAAAGRKYIVEDDGMNGFFSGYKEDKEGTKDFSLAGRLFDKTLVTKEGATLVESPIVDTIISQARALYDGDANRSYNNGLNHSYKGLQFNWILSGTKKLRDLDQSELGQRFIDYQIMDKIDAPLEDVIMDRHLESQLGMCKVIGNCKVATTMDQKYLKACQLTGGYVDHLRRNLDELVQNIEVPESVKPTVKKLAVFVEYLRARPSSSQEGEVGRALATRIGGQLIKLAFYLAVVMQKRSVDREVMKVVEKVGLDTARGRTFEIVKALEGCGTMGLDLKGVCLVTKEKSHEEANYLNCLLKLGAVEQFDDGKPSIARSMRWRLTKDFKKLYRDVMKGAK